MKLKTLGKDLPISLKHSVALCKLIKNKTLAEVEKLLKDVVKKKLAVPMKGELPYHKIGSTSKPSRYPVKAARYFLKLLKNIGGEIKYKGLSNEDVIIKKAIANKASRPYRATRIAFGRKRFKRTHLLIEAEVKEVKEEKKGKGTEGKEEMKKEMEEREKGEEGKKEKKEKKEEKDKK